MPDERSIDVKLSFSGDNGLDEAKKKQQELKQDIKETGDELDKVGVNMAGIGTRARSAFSTASGVAKSFGTTVRSCVLSSIKSGDSLGKIIKTGVGAGFQWAGKQAKGFGAGTVSVAKSIGSAFAHPIQTIKSTLGHALDDARKSTDDLGKASKKSGDDLKGMNDKGKSSGEGLIGVLKRVAAAALAIGAISMGVNALKGFGVASVNAAASAEETQSKFETVFKDQAARSEAWIESFSSAAKRSSNEVKGFMADSQAFLTGVGMGTEPAAEMAASLTSLSYDLASFHNIADQDAFDKLRSGMMGETEGLKTLGVVLNEASLKEAALGMGIRKNFNDLDEATKMQVRYNAILAQTGDAQTDVTRTTDSYTNGLKGIKGLWSDFMADAGAKFLPAIMLVFNAIMDNWPKIEPLLMGVVDALAGGLADIAPMLIDLGMSLLPTITDTLTILFNAIKPILPVIVNLIGTLLPPLLSLFGTLAETVLPPLTAIFDVLIRDVITPLLPVIHELISALLPPFVQLLGMVAPILQMLAPFLSMLGQLLAPIGSMLGTFISSLLPPIMQILDVIFTSILKPLMPILQQLAMTLLPVVAQMLGLIAPFLQLIAPILEAISPIISFIGDVLGFIADVIAKIVGGIADFVGSAIDFFGNLFGGAKEANAEMAGLAGSLNDVNAANAAYTPPDYTVPGVTTPQPGTPQVGSVSAIPATFEMPDMQPFELPAMKPIPAPDMSVYTGGVTTAMGTMPKANDQALAKVETQTANHMEAMGVTTAETYAEMEASAVKAWEGMVTAATEGVETIVQQFKKLGVAAASVGSVTIGTQGVRTESLPHYATGTKHYPGGPAVINEGGRDEVVILPDGSEVIPGDDADRLISNSSRRTTKIEQTFQINITGNPTQEQKRETEAWIREVARKEREEAERATQAEIRIQEAYA